MGNDNIFFKRQRDRIKRIENVKEMRESTWLIICEGSKTEVNYFKKLEKYLNDNGKRRIKINAFGQGRNTTDLISHVNDYFKFVDKKYGEFNIKYSKVITVFDADSFGKEKFNTAISMAERNGYAVAWSNECFELWILLHFQYCSSALGRKDLLEKVNNIFMEKCNKKYSKSDDEIFETSIKYGSLSTAIKNSEKLYRLHKDVICFKPSDANPATTVHRVIKMLVKEAGCNIYDNFCTDR